MGHVPMNGQRKTYTHINVTKAAKMINPPQDIAILIDFLWLVRRRSIFGICLSQSVMAACLPGLIQLN
jgi:anthranilate/para-aminobenzoate synthase component II